MESSPVVRILIGVVSVLFLVGYVAWRFMRAGQVVEAQAAFGNDMSSYFAAMMQDPRWLRLQQMVQARYLLAPPGTNPQAYVVQHVALVDDQAQMYAQHSHGATRVVALLVRAQPSSQIYVSMDLANGSVREDPAPYGWTYLGPPR